MKKSFYLFLTLIWGGGFLQTGAGVGKEAEVLQNKVLQDVEQLCEEISERYVYFSSRESQWENACEKAREEAHSLTTEKAVLGLFERLMDALFDNHASLGTNSPESPRLVPSGTDIWVELRGEEFLITAVRMESTAAAEGVRVGDTLLCFNGEPIDQALLKRIPDRSRQISSQQKEWAANAVVAGFRHEPRILTIKRKGQISRKDLSTQNEDSTGSPLTAELLAGEFAYIRFNNSLGQNDTVAAFDKAAEKFQGAKGWVIDLRNTPGGGNTGVAEPILGRFISEAMDYQRILEPGRAPYNRRVEPKGPWTIEAPVAVIVGRWTGSMGEGIAIGFDGMGRGKVFGSKMARLAGGTEAVSLKNTGIPVRFPTYNLAHIDGTPRHLWAPGLPIISDNGNGPDLALKKALEWLSQQP